MSDIALVTSGNRGLGFEIARQLAQAEMTVVVGSRDPQNGDEAAELLRSHGPEVEAVTLDD